MIPITVSTVDFHLSLMSRPCQLCQRYFMTSSGVGLFGASKACSKRFCKGLLWDWRFSGIKGLAVMVAH